MNEPGVFRVGRRELYRTALEFERVAGRIERALPSRKQSTGAMLSKNARKIAEQLAEMTTGVTHGSAVTAHRDALRASGSCCDVLDHLQMVGIGGFSDVTTGLELLERLVAGISQLTESRNEHVRDMSGEDPFDHGPDGDEIRPEENREP